VGDAIPFRTLGPTVAGIRSAGPEHFGPTYNGRFRRDNFQTMSSNQTDTFVDFPRLTSAPT